MESARRLLILDSVNIQGAQPGTLLLRENADIPPWLNTARLSAHQQSFAETLALCSLRDILPPQMALIGLVPERLDFGQTLSRGVRATMSKAMEIALNQLAAWGINPAARTADANCIARELREAFLLPTT